MRRQAWSRGPQPPLSHCYAVRAGERSQRGGAALARLPTPGPRRFHAMRFARSAVEH